MAHARNTSRKNKMGMAQTALRKFARLYVLEKQLKDLIIEQRYLLCQEKKKTFTGRVKVMA